MKKRFNRLLAGLLALITALSLTACQSSSAKSLETTPCPISELQWGMTLEQVQDALPAGCTLEESGAQVQWTQYRLLGYKNDVFGCSPTGDDTFITLWFRRPFTYQGDKHELLLSDMTLRLSAKTFDTVKTAMTRTLGTAAETTATPKTTTVISKSKELTAKSLMVWIPSGKGIQGYPAEVEGLAAAMYGAYFGTGLPEGYDLTNHNDLDKLIAETGEIDFTNMDAVRRNPEDYKYIKGGCISVEDYTECGLVVIQAHAGLPVFAATAQGHLK